MWKKDEVEPPRPSTPTPAETRIEPQAPKPQGKGSDRAVIGRSITIKGDVTGDEDLLIQGQVDGSVDLQKNGLTIGSEGRVKADLRARIITVEGEVEGDLKAKEQIILRTSAQVQGDLTAPRVVLEDGATFRGLVDMGDPMGKAEGGSGAGSKPSEASGPDAGKEKASASEKGGSSFSGDATGSSGTGKDASMGTTKAKL